MRGPTAPTRPPISRPGSPGWWAERDSGAAGRRRPGRPSRSFEQIVAAAWELVDEVGVSAFSMRALAGKLNTSTATLYRHVTGKDELMVHVFDRFLGRLVPGAAPVPASSWQDVARRRVVALHHALSEHPNLLALFVSEVPIGPNGLALREAVIADLVGFGFTVQLAARAYTTLAHYVVGFAMQQHAPGAPAPGQAAALRRYYTELDAERFPCTVAAADALTGVGAEAEFLEGLQFILDGIDQAAGA